MSDPKVIVFGGYGTFGRHVVRELADRDVAVTVAGRSLDRARRVAEKLGSRHRGLVGDVSNRSMCEKLLAGHRVAVNCAGPFSQFDTSLPLACLARSCHYVDIADDRQYVRQVRKLSGQFRDRRLAAVYGCSSLPAISGSLALLARQRMSSEVRHVRVTLFIGNDNQKGRGAVSAAAAQLGKEIRAPQGPVLGFRDPEFVPLPPPFGRRRVLNFESPDYDLLPALIGARSVIVKVGFESRVATWLFQALATLAPRIGCALLPQLSQMGGGWLRYGSSGGAVMVELEGEDGRRQSLASLAKADGQHMAALPCAIVAERLARDVSQPIGAVAAYDVVPPAQLLGELESRGFLTV